MRREPVAGEDIETVLKEMRTKKVVISKRWSAIWNEN